MSRNAPQLPNNTTTPSIATVNSSAGFSAGDLIYFQNGDYKNTTNLTGPSTASFGLTLNYPITGNNEVSAVFSPGTTTNKGGSSNGIFAATLTNGNIVQVWYSPLPTNGVPYYRIVTTAGVEVVAATAVTATTGLYLNGGYNNINVVALTGGGFAVFWVNATSATITYAIYTNAGAVTTAATSDSTFSSITTPFLTNGVALANGGFAITAKDTSNVVRVRAYDATGTGAYATVTTLTSDNANTRIGMATRSDSSIIVIDKTAANTPSYFIVSATGTTLVGTTAITPVLGTSTLMAVDATTLADGTTFVLAYANRGVTNAVGFVNAFRFLPTGNVIGAEKVIPTVNLNFSSTGNYAPSYLCVKGLSSGGFIFSFSDAMRSLQYAFFDLSGNCISGTNANGALPRVVYQGFAQNYSNSTMLEVGSNINLYYQTFLPASAVVSQSQYLVQINKATCETVLSNSTTQINPNPTTAAVSGAVAAVATPLTVPFYAATTGYANYITSLATTLGQTVVNAVSAYSVKCATLPNGTILIAYQSAVSGSPIYVAVYSATGVFQQTILVSANAYSSGAANILNIATLPNGKFAVIYPSTSTQAVIACYSSSFTLIAATAIVTTTPSNDNPLCIAGLSNNRYVTAFPTTSNLVSTAVFDENGLVLIPSTAQVNARSNWNVSADLNGNFLLSAFHYNNVLNDYYYHIFNGTTYSAYGNVTVATTAGSVPNFSTIFSENGLAYSLSAQTSNQINVTAIQVGRVTPVLLTYSGLSGVQSPVGNTNMALGKNGYGMPVMVYRTSTPQTTIVGLYPAVSQRDNDTSGIVNSPANFPGTSLNTLSTWSGGSSFSLTPGYGFNVVFCCLNTNGYPTFGIINTAPVSKLIQLVAGVTTSAPFSIVPNNTTTGIGNTILAGVALTNTAAGSSGQILINGFTQLNSSYTLTSSGAFDYTGQGIDGVRGIYNGKNITLQGNS